MMIANRLTDGNLGGLVEAARALYGYPQPPIVEGVPLHEGKKERSEGESRMLRIYDDPPARLNMPSRRKRDIMSLDEGSLRPLSLETQIVATGPQQAGHVISS
ncbi:MAG: hypothetical protein WC655_18870 [Candidatus Hydrogenedentales bacterium]